MKKELARREFLKSAGRGLAFLGFGSALYEGTLFNLVSKAYAASTGVSLNPGGYYVHLSIPGGPPRWYFDLPLTPGGKTASNFVAGGFGNILESSASGIKSVYTAQKFTAAGKSLYLPPVWGMGAARPFTEILPHTVFVRGMDMEINSHVLSRSRQVAPIIGGLSVTGSVADASQRPVPGIIDPSTTAGTAFKSHRGLSASQVQYTDNPISSILTPFKNYMAGRAVHAADKSRLPAQAFSEFETYAQNQGFTSNAVAEMYDSAMDMIEGDVFALSSNWAATVAKYRALITQAISPAKGSLPGFFDRAVPSQNSNFFRYDLDKDKVTLTDARDMVNGAMVVPRMAENFAIAEILLDKVTSNMTLALPNMEKLQSGHGLFNLTHDQHRVGNIVSTMMTTLFYRALLACTTEFVAVLKARGLFDRTVIHISSEFNRTPRIDGSGADHGFMGSNATLISGMIKKPAVIGNIQKGDYTTIYKGTFGVAAPYVLEGFNRPIQVNDVARTLTSMLGVGDIVTNGRALLQPSGANGWVPKKEEAENV